MDEGGESVQPQPRETSKPKATWADIFPQARDYFLRKYQEYHGFPMPTVRAGMPYPRHPKTGLQIRPNIGNIDLLPKAWIELFGEQAKRIWDKRQELGYPDIMVHGTRATLDIVQDGSLWQRSHFGFFDQIDPNTPVADTTIGSLHRDNPDFLMTVPVLTPGGDIPVDRLLLVVADPGRGEYLQRRFEAMGKGKEIILLEDLLNYMEIHNNQLPILEIADPEV